MKLLESDKDDMHDWREGPAVCVGSVGSGYLMTLTKTVGADEMVAVRAG